MLLVWINIGSGDDLLPEGTKPFPECRLIINVFSGIQITAIFQEVLVLTFCKVDVKSALLKLLPQLPETRGPFY